LKITTTATVAAPRELVFAALNDHHVLRGSIPGCEELQAIDADSFAVTIKLGLAGIKGSYHGTIVRRDVRPPESFTLAFDGKGMAGFIRGEAAVRILDQGASSTVDCDADVQIGGALAAVGSRLIGAASRKLTQDFFRQLAIQIGVQPEPVAGE
jgi:carbon monoxide dehydrogenase subunit G